MGRWRSSCPAGPRWCVALFGIARSFEYWGAGLTVPVFTFGGHIATSRQEVVSSLRPYFAVILGLFVLFSAFYAAFPRFDLYVSHLFFTEGAGFTWSRGWLCLTARDVYRGVYILALVVSFYFVVSHHLADRRRSARPSEGRTARRAWLFLFLCLVIGPGVVANLVFKSHWGRARPVHLIEFSGAAQKHYTPPLQPANQCDGSSCSFVSGEASNMYALFFALSFLAAGATRRRLFVAGWIAGGTAGLVRMAQGGHFLSDVLFAGLFMWLTVALVYLVMTAATRKVPHFGATSPPTSSP